MRKTIVKILSENEDLITAKILSGSYAKPGYIIENLSFEVDLLHGVEMFCSEEGKIFAPKRFECNDKNFIFV